MKIGITGGAGFIGGHVAEHAIDRGHDVVIFDRRGRLAEDAVLYGRGHAERFLGDVNDPIAVTELAAHVDGIIHLAACLGTQETIANPRPSAATNVLGGLNVLEASVQYRGSDGEPLPVAYIGVGNWWMENSYSISKHTVERYIRMYNRERGARVNVVRAVNAYGPRQSVAPPFGPAKVRKITPAFVCRALTGQPIEIYGDGTQISDMVHVRDVARTLVAALEAAAKGTVLGDAVSVGPHPDASLSVNQVANIIRNIVTFRDMLGGLPQPEIIHVPMRPGEVPGDRVSADPWTLRLVGVDPESLIPFDVGIRETIVWFAENWLPGYLAMQSADTAAMAAVSAVV